MKLRNKKTGEIMQGLELSVIEYGFGHEWMRDWSYNSIKAFLEDWEDVKENSPAEPLIKDEKKLDTVKSFFALLGISNKIYYQSINNCFYKTDDDGITYGIDFNDDNGIDNICTGLPYTLAELCGEEEE